MRNHAEFQLLRIHVRVAGQPVSLCHGAPYVAMIGVLLIVLPRIVAQHYVGFVFSDEEDQLRTQFVQRNRRSVSFRQLRLMTSFIPRPSLRQPTRDD